MDETGLRVEMTALYPNRRLPFVAAPREQPRKMLSFQVGERLPSPLA